VLTDRTRAPLCPNSIVSICCGFVVQVVQRYLQQHTYMHPFNGPLSETTRVSRYQEGKTSLDLLGQETVSGSGISWAMCKSAPRPRRITTPASHHSVFYRPDALPASQRPASKHKLNGHLAVSLLVNKALCMGPTRVLHHDCCERWRFQCIRSYGKAHNVC